MRPTGLGPLAAVLRVLAGAAWVALLAASAWATSLLLARSVGRVAGSREAPWILGRAAGMTSYLLLLALVCLGLLLSHPTRTGRRRPSRATRIRVHVVLAVFWFAFTVLHVVVLATDRYAGVGWPGALVPMGAAYRPVPVTLGVLAGYAGLAAGATALLAGRVVGRLWWPIHKVAGVVLVLGWGHGVLAGTDSTALRSVYLITGVAVLALAGARYVARTPADHLAEAAPPTGPAPGSPAALEDSPLIRLLGSPEPPADQEQVRWTP